MNLTKNGDSTHVALSERNLRHLLAVYEQDPQSACLTQRQLDGSFVTVLVEPDEKHYEGRTPGSGLQHLINLANRQPK